MDTELTESLPSESMFVPSGSSKDVGDMKAKKDFSPISAADYINASTPGSDKESSIVVGVQDTPAKAPGMDVDGGNPVSAKSSTLPFSGKKPFLRKGSRKEPSALHRIQARASPITTLSSSGSPVDRGGGTKTRSTTPSFVKENARTRKSGLAGGESFDVEGYMDHALSSGLKHNNGFEHSAPQKNDTGLAGSAINSSPISVSSDPHETSGTFEVEWKSLHEKRTQSMRELDEFVVLEQQLESLPTMRGAGDKGDDNVDSNGCEKIVRSLPSQSLPESMINLDVSSSRGPSQPNPPSRHMDITVEEEEDNGGEEGSLRGEGLETEINRYESSLRGYDRQERNSGAGVTAQSHSARRPVSSYSSGEGGNNDHPPRPELTPVLFGSDEGYKRNEERGRDEERVRFDRERTLLGYDNEDDDDSEEGITYVYDVDDGHHSDINSMRLSSNKTTGTRAGTIGSGSVPSCGGERQKPAGDNHRGRGVHHEGGTMSGLLDHSKGPMINRPRSSYSSKSSGKSTDGAVVRKRGDTAGNIGGVSPSESPSQVAQVQVMQMSLREKAIELERELATYKAENMKIKSLKRQQEASIADLTHQKAETAKWCEEEKKKCENFVLEQKKIAARERRNAAKVASDARREGNAQSARKAAAGMEVLEATNARLKSEAEAGAKKARMTERRLQTLVKDQNNTIDELRGRVSGLESALTALRAYCDRVGVRIPAAVVRGSVPKSNSSNNGSSTKVELITSRLGTTGAKRPKADTWRTTSYVEEVSLPSAERTNDEEDSAGITTLIERDAPSGTLSSAIFGSSVAGAGKAGEEEGESEVGSVNVGSGEYHPGRYSSSYTNRDNTIMPHALLGSHDYSHSDSLRDGANDRTRDMEAETEEESIGLGIMHVRSGQDQRASWAHSSGDRSNRSSTSTSDLQEHVGTSGRYSTDGDKYDDDDEDNVSRHSEESESESGNFHLPSSGFAIDARAPVTDSSLEFASTGMASHSMRPRQWNDVSGSSSGIGNGNGSGGGSGHGRTEEILPDGRRLVRYRNGTVKEVYPDGRGTVVRFINGDTKSTEADGTVVYFYCDADTTHTTRKDGCEVYQFPNGQTERHYPDGLKEILFPDYTRKVIYPSGVTESFFPDGATVKEFPESGEKVFTSVDGNIEKLSVMSRTGVAGRA